MSSTEDNIIDPFEYSTQTSSDIDVEFIIEIVDGISFSKLFDCLKNGTNAVIKFTDTSMTYIEMRDTEEKKNKFTTDILCEFNIKKFKTYIFKSKSSEYNLYIDVKTFVDKVKKSTKDSILKMVKKPGSDTISIYKSASLSDVSYFKPLVMQNCETFRHNIKSYEVANSLIKSKKIYTDSQKLSPATFKKVTIRGYKDKMEVEAKSVYGSDGHLFNYDNSSTILPKTFNINFNLLSGVVDKVIPDPIVIKNELIMEFEIPTSLFKNISKLVKLNDNDTKVFFQNTNNENYMKIITDVKNYATVYYYIMPDI